MGRFDSPGQIWLYRTKPQDDELFSSWLVRLASGLALKLQTFTTQVLRLHAGFWTGDIDRVPNTHALERLCDGTGVSPERARSIGLAAYEGILWQDYKSPGPMAWLTPIGRNGRYHELYGQQYCRRCLEEDDRPYFRRKWRLAFNVLCETHGTLLQDACPLCGAPVEFHTGDFGQRLLEFECQITRCGACRGDFRQWTGNADRSTSRELADFQRSLNEAVQQGFHEELPGGRSYSHLLFDGLRHIVQLLCSRGRFGRARDALMASNGLLGFNMNLDARWQKFEALRVGDRAFILDMARQLMCNWPSAFVGLCRSSRVSSSYLLRYRNDLPYWFSSEVEWYLDDRDYAPCDDERAAVKDFLVRNNLPVSRNSINRWLGVSSVNKLIRKPNSASSRWNPRGATAIKVKHV